MHVPIELLNKCINNDRKAQYELYKACYSFILSICYRYFSSKDDALAVQNEIFLKIILNLSKYKGEGAFEAWVRKVAVNTIVDKYRKDKKLKATIVYTDMAAETLQETSPEENEVEIKLATQDIYRLIHLLPPMYGKVFNLFVIDGYSHKEIAEMLSISEGTSKSNLYDARKKLQQMIAKQQLQKAPSNEPAK